MNLCTLQQSQVGIAVTEYSVFQGPLDNIDILLHWGPNDHIEGVASVIGRDEIAVITHPDNPIRPISKEQLFRIYMGETWFWEQLTTEGSGFSGDIHAWTYPPDDTIRKIFESSISDSELHNPFVYIAPHPEAMLQALANDPLAIGFLPSIWLDTRVRELAVDGFQQGTLSVPILAFTNGEFQEKQLSWLKCLEDQFLQ
ncbi:MAG: hypothetical protein MUO76_22295 [Anaerolineaceae bacterium]|nr:hypothetical protein [Anaerolineaceae bacterium]